jgi:hypothetical protein
MFDSKVAKPQTKTAAGSTNNSARQHPTLVARPFGGGAVEQASTLQGTIGNQSTLRYLTQRLSNPPAEARGEHHPTEAARVTKEAPSIGWDFSKIPVFAPDRANRPQASSPLTAPRRPSDRGSESPQTEPELRSPPLFVRSAAPRDVWSVLNGPGHPLDTAAISDFRTSFGYDFSTVRVHTDERAAACAASLSARAYTIGRHVVFGRGEYAPGTPTGRHLLGHELAHVVQQSRGGPAAPDGQNPILEAAADHAANQASRGAPVLVAGNSAVGVACKTLFEDFSGGDYSWNFLKLALEHDRPVSTIVDDVNALASAERGQAIKDITQERAERGRKQADLTARKASQTDPKLQAVFDPMLEEGKRVLDRIDAVLGGLALRQPIPGWNFTPGDFAKLQRANKNLTVAPDSSWFPAKFQENLLKTLAFVLGPQVSPAATEGVSAVDFFHGHLVVKKAPETETQVKSATATSQRFSAEFEKARTKALGEVRFSKGYPLTEKTIGAYKQAVEKVEPSLSSLLDNTAKIPGAAVMYHTFEFNQPSDLKAKGQKLKSEDPRRHYVTPLATNTPVQYSPPAGGYETEFTHITSFSFLVDDQGAVHVRPFGASTGFTTLELSTITGTTYPEPL